jgi:hypothetical protein
LSTYYEDLLLQSTPTTDFSDTGELLDSIPSTDDFNDQRPASHSPLSVDTPHAAISTRLQDFEVALVLRQATNCRARNERTFVQVVDMLSLPADSDSLFTTTLSVVELSSYKKVMKSLDNAN